MDWKAVNWEREKKLIGDQCKSVAKQKCLNLNHECHRDDDDVLHEREPLPPPHLRGRGRGFVARPHFDDAVVYVTGNSLKLEMKQNNDFTK